MIFGLELTFYCLGNHPHHHQLPVHRDQAGDHFLVSPRLANVQVCLLTLTPASRLPQSLSLPARQ